jgi:hypothetical protein
MEITCTRCHQTVQDDNCYCPTCGLPRLVYSAEGAQGLPQPERWNEPVRDASTVAWKPAIRAAVTLAIPAGILCSMLSPVSIFGLFLMAMAAAWTVVLYMRSQRPAWITVGAGARIGLVTGLMGSWIAAATTGVTLFVMRFFLHQGRFFDDFWNDFVNQQMVQQWTSMGVDASTIAMTRAWLMGAEGRAGAMLSAVLFLAVGLLLFAVGGGALGARLLARSRKPEI